MRKSIDPSPSDSVRLLNGSSLCSGRLQVRSNHTWASVCEADFDQQDAEVACRELGCGPPSVLQGALYGDEEAPVWTREFQCGGNESALLDCRSSGSDRSTCSPGRAVGLTCSGRRGAATLIRLCSDQTHFILLLTTLCFLFRASQVGGRSQSLCRSSGAETGTMETSGRPGLDSGGGSCRLWTDELWFCCFCGKKTKSVEKWVVDQRRLCSVWISCAGVCIRRVRVLHPGYHLFR